MSRASYIYLVRFKYDHDESREHALLGAFTVKYEAEAWTKRWCGPKYPLNRLQLSRIRDGLHHLKNEVKIPWSDDNDFREKFVSESSDPVRSAEAPEAG